MYEPIRTKSVHALNDPPPPGIPHRTREEELDIQLAGHLTALLTVTDELRAHTPSAELDAAAQRIADEVARLRDGRRPLRAAPTTGAGGATAGPDGRIAKLHQRAHTLAGRALVVAGSREDAGGAALAAERLDAHAAELGVTHRTTA
ncbi:hypothetical protein ACH429_15705 [Streptomyces pathocidini]|uniref:Uncharacterized protein n=1 Tax=Streptomyces pathocidini TaxID=1650571 RepID=A0ABW7UVS4_9ACTN